jgi:hypothetical protein
VIIKVILLRIYHRGSSLETPEGFAFKEVLEQDSQTTSYTARPTVADDADDDAMP